MELKTPLCNETRFLNFFLSVAKSAPGHKLTSVVWEYFSEIAHYTINPDILCYFETPSPFYLLFELKQRNTFSPADLNENFLPQYQGYLFLRDHVESLDANYIPVKVSAPLSITYQFHNSDQDVIRSIVAAIPIDNTVYVSHLSFQPLSYQILQGPANSASQALLQYVQQSISIPAHWTKFYVPFTSKDLQGIRGKGGKGATVPRIQANILASHLLGFILQRKSMENLGTFSLDEVLTYLFEGSNVKLGEKERITIRNKLRLVLEYLASTLFPTLKLDVIRQAPGGYQIILRKTKALHVRITEIQSKIVEWLQQTTLDEFFS